MSEYWVSKKRYFCKYCDTYIADDVPSRQHHENGLRHKGNVDRFVRGLYKAGEKQKKDADEEKREMMRIEQAASAAFAEDVGAGRAQYASPPSAAPRASTSSSQKPRTPGGISDYSTPESLGYTDPDLEHARVEAERRSTQGFAGEWQLVATSEETRPEHNTRQTEESQEEAKKRPLLDPADEDEGRWKLRKKMANVGLGEIYDPGIISIKPKAKVEIDEGVAGNDRAPSASTPSDTGATAVPKWAPVKWNKAGERVHETNDAAGPAPATDNSRTDGASMVSPEPPGGEEESKLASVTNVPVKEETLPVKLEELPGETIPAGGSLFRKRKTPARGGTNSSGRRF